MITSIVLGVLCLLSGLVILNLSELTSLGLKARLHHPVSEDIQSQLQALKREARSRAMLYNTHIERDHLLDGMVVDKDLEGSPKHMCDSLLFSALRYRALVSLQFNDSAAEAWEAMLASRDGGQWYRHPQCSQKSLSRDMLMGLFVVLEARPFEGRQVVMELFQEIDQRRGSFSDGPFFVSYLSPGPAGLLRYLAEGYKIPSSQWPWVIKQSFSSIEYDAMFLKPGFESHLAGIGLWLEYQFLTDPRWLSGVKFNPRSLLGEIQKNLSFLGDQGVPPIERSRLLWIANKLSQDNPQNLFFATLRLQLSGAFSDQARISMLKRLLEMPQFPSDRLPGNCDKDADYIWQRRDSEQVPVHKECTFFYSGVDYLWMAGMLAGE
jgi:hypothetical protein